MITKISERLWDETWRGLGLRGRGGRETACVWLGKREPGFEEALTVIFLDDLPGTIGHRLHHRTSREAVNLMLERARALDMMIVGDVHTHPADWVDLSEVDRAHPIEYRVGLLAVVIPWYGAGTPDVFAAGVHEYAGEGQWRSFSVGCISDRLVLQSEPH